MLKHQRLRGLFGREKRQRYFWKAAFLRAEAGPESRIDNCLNGSRRRRGGQLSFTARARFGKVSGKVSFDGRRDCLRCMIRRFPRHDWILTEDRDRGQRLEG